MFSNEGAVPRLCAWSLQSEPDGWTSVLLQPNTDHSAGSGGPLALVVSLTHRSNSLSRKAVIIKLSKHLLVFVVNLFYSEKRILDFQSGAGTEWK